MEQIQKVKPDRPWKDPQTINSSQSLAPSQEQSKCKVEATLPWTKGLQWSDYWYTMESEQKKKKMDTKKQSVSIPVPLK